MSNATFEPGPLLSKIADELEATIRAVIASEGDEWDDDDLRGLVKDEVRYGGLDFDYDLVVQLIADTPDIILLRYPESENFEKVSLHTAAEYVMRRWLIVTLQRRIRN
jgi:hypothetical protein